MKKAVSLILCVLMVATLFSGIVVSNAAATVVSARINEATCNVEVTFSAPVDMEYVVNSNIYIANTVPEWQNIDGSVDDVEQLDADGKVFRFYFTDGSQSMMSATGEIRIIMDAGAGIYDIETDEPLSRISVTCERFNDPTEKLTKNPVVVTPPVEEIPLDFSSEGGVVISSDGRLVPTFYDKVETFETGKTPTKEIFIAFDTAGPEKGDGTRENPFTKFSQAQAVVKPGEAIRILPGTYTTHATGKFMDFSDLHGTADKPIWIGGIPGEAMPILKGSKEAVNCLTSSYLVFHDITVEGATENGFNVSDGGKLLDYNAAHHFVFRSLRVFNTGSGGNDDSFKFSGINNFWFFDNEASNKAVLNTTAGDYSSSGIDHVGCQEAYIAGNYFHDLRGNAFQFKGGGYDADITQNLMVNCGERAVIIGGYAGLDGYRMHPDVRAAFEAGGPAYEATEIRVYSNIFIGTNAPVAFVTAKDCYFVNNTIINPERYFMRILHEDPIPEDKTERYVDGNNSYNTISNNIFYYGSLSENINHNGPSDAAFHRLEPETFTVENNLYFSTTNRAMDASFNFVPQVNAIIGQDPMFVDFDSNNFNLTAGSPAIAAGVSVEQFDWLTVDFNGKAINKKNPTIGALTADGTAPAKKFTDLAGFSWAESAINALAAKGIINGVSPTEFAPGKQITRADYMLLLVRMLGLTADVTENFDDVAPGKYYYREVGIAKALGLTDGVGNNHFNPEAPITRQDMFVLAYRILLQQNASLADAPASDLDAFADGAQVSDYAKAALAVLVKNSLVQGNANQLNPKGNATRAETAVFVYRLYNLLNA